MGSFGPRLGSSPTCPATSFEDWEVPDIAPSGGGEPFAWCPRLLKDILTLLALGKEVGVEIRAEGIQLPQPTDSGEDAKPPGTGCTMLY